MHDEGFQRGGDRLPPTRRLVIEAVACIDAEERECALESICAAYWKPIYKYIRLRWTRPADETQDLTQGFFVEVLERELSNGSMRRKRPSAPILRQIRSRDSSKGSGCAAYLLWRSRTYGSSVRVK